MPKTDFYGQPEEKPKFEFNPPRQAFDLLSFKGDKGMIITE